MMALKQIQALGTRSALAALLCFAPLAAQAQYEYVTNNGTITITAYTGPGGAVTIPDTIDGLPVTSIGQGAFYGSGLTSVIIGNSVTSIGESAFSDCTSLASVIIPDSVVSVGFLAFDSCAGLTNVTIGSSVTSVEGYAFADCFSLTGVCFRGNAPSADSSVFENADNVTVYYFPGTANWGPTFAGRPTVLIPYYSTINNGTVIITGYTGPGGDVIIPSEIVGLPVTSIEGWQQCTIVHCSYYGVFPIGVTSVTIPDSVTSIGSWAFYGCRSLTNIVIDNSVTNIGLDAFVSCTSLTAITVNALNAAYSSVDGVMFDKSQTTLIQCPGGKAGSYTIPDSVTSIEVEAFSSCTSLTSVIIPDSVISIAGGCDWWCNYHGAFNGCNSLSEVFFEGNVPTISLSVFDGSSKATIYYLPGTTGWGTTFGGRPTAPWYLPNPLILDFHSTFGVQSNHFGFTISWATNTSVAVEACTNLANPVWSPVGTNTIAMGVDPLTDGWSYFSDPDWTNHPARFYRLR